MTTRQPPPRFTTRLEVMVPEVLPRAIELAAERALTTQSEYARQALIAKLRADGIDLLALSAPDVFLFEAGVVFPPRA